MNLAWSILYRSYRMVSGMRHWAQRRFTRAGFTVLGAFMATGSMAVDTENNISYQGFTLLFSVLIAAACFGWVFRARYSASRLLPRFGTVGVPLHYQVRLH